VNELKYIKNELSIDYFLFCSDNFTQNKEWVENLCEEIISCRLKINWICNSRVDTIDEELIKKMKLAGCYLVTFGAESGDDHLLNIMKKNTKNTQNKNAVELCKKYKILSNLSFVVGFPGETKSSLKKTRKMILDAKPDSVTFFMATPLPKTELWEQNKTYLKSEPFSSFIYNKYILREELSEKELRNFIQKSILCLYTNPKYLLRNLIRLLKNPRDNVKIFLHSAGKFIVTLRTFN